LQKNDFKITCLITIIVEISFKKSLFSLHKVVREEFVSEVGTFIFLWSQFLLDVDVVYQK